MITWKLIVMRNDSKGKVGQGVLFAYSKRPNGSRKSRQASQEVAEGMGGEVARYSSNARGNVWTKSASRPFGTWKALGETILIVGLVKA